MTVPFVIFFLDDGCDADDAHVALATLSVPDPILLQAVADDVLTVDGGLGFHRTNDLSGHRIKLRDDDNGVQQGVNKESMLGGQVGADRESLGRLVDFTATTPKLQGHLPKIKENLMYRTICICNYIKLYAKT